MGERFELGFCCRAPSFQTVRIVTLLLHGVIFVALEMRLIGSSTWGYYVPFAASESASIPVWRPLRGVGLELLIFTTWPSYLLQL